MHFSDATIIMTSNLASELWFRRRMGFGERDREVEVAEGAVSDVLRRKLPAEFMSRIDEVVVFHPLADSQILQITGFKLDAIVRALFARQGIDMFPHRTGPGAGAALVALVYVLPADFSDLASILVVDSL